MRTADMTLRNATPADAHAIAGLLTELEHPTPADEIPARLANLAREGGTVLLAVDGGGTPLGLMSLASHATLHAPGPVACITALVVTSSARGSGVGRMFIAAAKDWAREKGCARLTVTSAEHRADAHAFYPACGMPYTGRRFSVSLA